MKLKYYLRGLGIGIILTVIIVLVADFGKKESLTEDEIIERAQELGMVMAEAEKSTVEDKTGKSEPETTLPNTGAPKVAEDKEADIGATSAEPDSGQQMITPETIYFTVEINKGEYSDVICNKLAEAGLITDAEDFNRYLISNGIDNLISVGKHEISEGSSYEEIAKILCESEESSQTQ